MFLTIINDCADANARGRQTSRLASLLSVTPSFVGTSSDVEAAGNLIDILDATEGRRGAILVNVAPRGGHARKWPNGTPFGYFHYHDTLIISSIDGLTLSLIKKFKLASEINLFDIPEAAPHLLAPDDVKAAIPHTQFRSLHFTPRAAHALLSGITLPTTPYAFTEIPDAPDAVWWVDNFGNCKTTLTRDDIDATEGSLVQTRWGEFPYVSKLADVPDGQTALIAGSSGLPDQPFLELVTQNRSTAKLFTIASGDDLHEDKNHSLRATDA